VGLHVSLFQLGLILGAFLLGAAIFQIPAGLAALRWGSRTVCLVALAAMGVFALASAFSPDWYVLAALRFATGAGAAFFFAPGLGLVATYYPRGSRGPIIGLYNSGFSVGAAVGVLLGAVVGLWYGWNWALAVGGIGLLAVALGASLALPRAGSAPPPVRLSGWVRAARPVLRSRAIWALGFALTGAWAGFYIVAQYFVQYAAHVHSSWSLTLAASLPTAMIAVEILGGPIGGIAAERARDMRTALVAFAAASAAAIALLPFLPLAALVPVFLFLGFADGVVFAVLYLIPSYHPEAQGEGLALALALINCVQIFAGSAVAVAFGYIAGAWGYTVAWVFAGAIGAVTLPLLYWVPGTRDPAAPIPDTPSLGPDPGRSRDSVL